MKIKYHFKKWCHFQPALQLSKGSHFWMTQQMCIEDLLSECHCPSYWENTKLNKRLISLTAFTLQRGDHKPVTKTGGKIKSVSKEITHLHRGSKLRKSWLWPRQSEDYKSVAFAYGNVMNTVRTGTELEVCTLLSQNESVSGKIKFGGRWGHESLGQDCVRSPMSF